MSTNGFDDVISDQEARPAGKFPAGAKEFWSDEVKPRQVLDSDIEEALRRDREFRARTTPQLRQNMDATSTKLQPPR